MINKSRIKKDFSRYAAYYDKYSFVQDQAALVLGRDIQLENPAKILEIGSGTGNYTKVLLKRFPKAKIFAVDISPDMIKIARSKPGLKKVKFILGDGEKLRFSSKFDLITSNAALQWFEDLDKTFLKYKKLLTDTGKICFSIFGPQTYQELAKSLSILWEKPIELTASQFIRKKNLIRIVNRYFPSSIVREESRLVSFDSALELLSHIKYTSGTGEVSPEKWTKRTLEKLEAVFKDKFGSISVTTQIFFVEKR